MCQPSSEATTKGREQLGDTDKTTYQVFDPGWIRSSRGPTGQQVRYDYDLSRATQIMLKVHREGMGICGIYPKDVAATKVEQVRSYAKQHQHPLQCVMEEN